MVQAKSMYYEFMFQEVGPLSMYYEFMVQEVGHLCACDNDFNCGQFQNPVADSSGT